MSETPTLDELLTHCGFERCIGFDGDEPCDGCDTPGVVYFGDRDVWDSREGSYYCESCLRERYQADAEFAKEMEEAGGLLSEDELRDFASNAPHFDRPE